MPRRVIVPVLLDEQVDLSLLYNNFIIIYYRRHQTISGVLRSADHAFVLLQNTTHIDDRVTEEVQQGFPFVTLLRRRITGIVLMRGM